METEWLRSSDANQLKFSTGGGLNQDKCMLVGLYGWRRRCLLFVLGLLLVVVLTNMTLSLWLLKVMHFSPRGMGGLRISEREVRLTGEAMVLDKLITSKVESRKGQPLHMESSKTINLQTRNKNDSQVTNRLFLGGDRLDVEASSLKISDNRGKHVLTVNSMETTVGAEALRISGDGGAIFHSSVQTPSVRPQTGHNLKLESPTRSLKVFALQGIHMESRAGNVNTNCLTDVKVHSKLDSVRLDAPKIYLPNVLTASTTSNSSHSKHFDTFFNDEFLHSLSNRQKTTPVTKSEVYQICVCGNGRLFLAPPDGPCVANDNVCR